MTKEKLIKEYLKAIKEENAGLFIGAGLSVPAGFVNWSNLLNDIADELGLDISEEKHDLISLVQFYMNKKRNRNAVNQLLLDKYGNKTVPPTQNHKILARLPIKYYWTTNYDNLIERAFDEVGKTPDVKKSINNLSTVTRKRDAIIYKMHGDIDTPHEAVLTKDDYEIYSKKNELFSIALRGDLVSKTFLFLGFSFEDPNLNYILSRMRLLLEDNVKEHYCIFRKVKRNDFNSDDSFARAEVKQELRVEDLKRYGIETLLVDEYTDITDILAEIENKYRLSNIFISGSAEVYGDWDENNALSFVRQLAYKIVSNDYKIISGFGKGIGFEVVNGVLDYVYTTKFRHLDQSVSLRPFPYRIADPDERKAKWTKYREDMLSVTGISLFMFGNKRVDGKIVQADGMREEYEISKKNGIKLIPIGNTGYMANELWNEVFANFQTFFKNKEDLKNDFEILNASNVNSQNLINTIIKIINILNT